MKQFFAILLISILSFQIASAEILQNYIVTDVLSETVKKNIVVQFKTTDKVMIIVSFKNNPQSNFTSFHHAFEIATEVQSLLGTDVQTTLKLIPEQEHSDTFSLTLQAN